MKITIACVGKLKEKYLTAALDEYVKRLQPFCKLEILSINEEKMPEVLAAGAAGGCMMSGFMKL